MKLATYNVNGVNGRLPVLIRWFEQSKPDVVCLQELKAPEVKFPVGAIEAAGYGAIWHGQKSWNGVAILARVAEPIETRRCLAEHLDRRGVPSQRQPAFRDAAFVLHRPEGAHGAHERARQVCPALSHFGFCSVEEAGRQQPSVVDGPEDF